MASNNYRPLLPKRRKKKTSNVSTQKVTRNSRESTQRNFALTGPGSNTSSRRASKVSTNIILSHTLLNLIRFGNPSLILFNTS